MNLLSTFLEKFKNLRPPESLVRNAVLKASREVVGVTLIPQSIRVQRSAVFLDVNPLIKTELMLRKKELLTIVNDELKIFGRVITDVR